MQNLATMSLGDVRRVAPTLSVSTIKSLIKACADKVNSLGLDRKKGLALKAGEEIMHDLLRKESILMKELVARGYHTVKDSEDFMKWRNEGAGRILV